MCYWFTRTSKIQVTWSERQRICVLLGNCLTLWELCWLSSTNPSQSSLYYNPTLFIVPPFGLFSLLILLMMYLWIILTPYPNSETVPPPKSIGNIPCWGGGGGGKSWDIFMATGYASLLSQSGETFPVNIYAYWLYYVVVNMGSVAPALA